MRTYVFALVISMAPCTAGAQASGDFAAAHPEANSESEPTAPADEPERVVLDDAPSEGAAAVETPGVASAPTDYGMTGADRMMLKESIDDIADERDAKYSLGGPIALLAVGGGFTIGGLVVAAYGAVFLSLDVYGTLDGPGKVMIIGGLSAAALGAGGVVGGLVWLNKRIEKRRPYNERIEDLENQLEYGAIYVQPLVLRNGAGLGLGGTF